MYTRLSNRAMHGLALCWAAVFLVLVVPGHQRGIVQLPNHDAVTRDGEPFCPLCSSRPADAGDEENQPVPPLDAPVNCAICLLKVNLDTPPALILPPTFYVELEYCLYAPDAIESVSVARRYRLRGRAPPALV